MTQENEAIIKLASDLRLCHFHQIGAAQLAEKLVDLGYRLIAPSKLTVLSEGLSPRDIRTCQAQRSLILKQLGVEEK